MKIHHLNCATLCPLGQKFLLGYGSPIEQANLVCHCLLIETNNELILIDTGLGHEDIKYPEKRMPKSFIKLIGRPVLDPHETALSQIKRLGFKQEDVRHIILTHLDVDHAGGIADFPDAKIHIYNLEFMAANDTKSFNEKQRYMKELWAHNPNWVKYDLEGENWKGFDCVRKLSGIPPEILLVPLVGHTRGHAGVAIKDGDNYLFHCGDAYNSHLQVHPYFPKTPAFIKVYERFAQVDYKKHNNCITRLRKLKENHPEIKLFCAHDPFEFFQY